MERRGEIIDSAEECRKEIRRLRGIIREMKNCVEYPFPKDSKVFGIAAYCNFGKVIYRPVQCYYIAPHRQGEHVVQGLMGEFKTVKDVFATKEEAENYVIDNQLE